MRWTQWMAVGVASWMLAGIVAARAGAAVLQSARDLPVAAEVDVVVVGGNTWAVSAAVEAANAGARVLLAAPKLYLGEDLCAALRLNLDDGQTPGGALGRRIFGDGRAATPMHVKKTLDEALLAANAQFLLGCQATEVLRDERGRPAGVVLCNRAGRQAVIAKVIIDGTDRAWVARLAGAKAMPWPKGPVAVERTIITSGEGGKPKTTVRRLELPMNGGGSLDLLAAEQAARDATFVAGQLRASEALFYVPPDPIVCELGPGQWRGEKDAALGHFKPAGVERVYIISGSAAFPRDAAKKLLAPTGLIELGGIVGAAAAGEAKTIDNLRGVTAPGAAQPKEKAVTGDIKEILQGLRPTGPVPSTIPSAPSVVEVLGEYDVVVIGGGTSGSVAAISSARRGAKTLVIECHEGLGGVGTLGLIGTPYAGRKAGFSAEVPFLSKRFMAEDKMEWYRREVRKAGGDVWLGVLGCGAVVEAGRVTGAVVALPQGRGVVLAKCVIDATGSADVAVSAGAAYTYGGDGEDIAMQGAGLPERALGAFNANTDYLLVDELDMLNVWSAMVGTRQAAAPAAWDQGSFIQTRERRTVVGDHTLRYLDQIAERTYSDSIVLSESDYDSHGYPLNPFFALFPHDARSLKANHPAPGGSCYTPYRCLLPRGLDGILVVGLGISMDRDASALMRMQLDMANQAYAAGVAAAMVASTGTSTRAIDIKALQRHLVEIGSLPKEVLNHEESFPLPDDAVRQAALQLAGRNREVASKALAILLSHRDAALPALREAYAKAGGEAKLTYAKVLGVMGDGQVVPVLAEALDRLTAWDAKVFQGDMAEYAHLPTPMDSLILALGYTKDRRALGPVLRKLEMLDAGVTLSHHRAVAVALEMIGDPAAAEGLAKLLGKPTMAGHAMTKLSPLPAGKAQRVDRGDALREITLARALYRCGDHQGLGRTILREYANDLRGLLARHAHAVLGENAKVQ